MKKWVFLIFIIFIAIIVVIPVAINFMGDKKELEMTHGPEQQIKVLNTSTKKIMKLPLEEYLVGVVAAEMPAAFEVEALKAQAVAARTYAVKRKLLFGSSRHENNEKAEVCTDPTHCQAWCSEEELKRRWGLLKYPLYMYKIKQAVKETEGKVLVYQDKLADPVYHGSCGGVGTEDSEKVWKYNIPYLRGVECRWDDMSNSKLTSSITLGTKEFTKRLGLGDLSEKEIAEIIEKGQYSKGGRLINLIKDQQVIPASIVRNKLNLPSTVVSWQIINGKVLIETKGKGHGVGMCQYGANGMAKEGKKYTEILGHYYKDTKITAMDKIPSQ